MLKYRFGVVALLCLTIIGCASPYYSPYGPGYSGIYGPPPAVPQGTTFQQGQFSMPGQGAAVAPTWGTTPTAPTLANPTGSDAPAYQPNPTPGSMKSVPNYQDPTIDQTSGSSSEANPFPYPEASLEGNPTSSIQPPPAPAGGIDLNGIDLTGAEEDYLKPIPVDHADYSVHQPVTNSPFPSLNQSNSQNDKNHLLAYDSDSYRWLRGVVRYDVPSKTWELVYSPNPDKSDLYAGRLTLQEDQRLGMLRNNDVVLVKGTLNSENRDQLGKPSYRITSISRVEDSGN